MLVFLFSSCRAPCGRVKITTMTNIYRVGLAKGLHVVNIKKLIGEQRMHLERGDIILMSKGSLIAKFMNYFQKDPCYWGHVALVKDSSTLWEASIVLREYPIAKKLASQKHYKIIRKIDLTDEQKELMEKFAKKLLGRPYGIKRIVLQFLDHIFHTNKFTSKADSKYLQVCSSYVAWVYWCACKYKFNNVPWQSCDPDDIEDDQLANKYKWFIVEDRKIYRHRHLS